MPIWKLLQADLPELASTDSGSGFGFRQELGQFESLCEALTMPLSRLVGAGFVLPVTNLWQRHIKRTATMPPLAETVNLIAEAVYLDQFCATLSQPSVRTWLQQMGNLAASEGVHSQFRTFATLPPVPAGEVITSFAASRLATELNRLLILRLTQLGIQPAAAEQVATRIAQKAEVALPPALTQLDASMSVWLAWYQDSQLQARHLELDAYLDQIATQPLEPVFTEAFCLRDLYVPLKAQCLTCNGETDFDHPPIDLASWVMEQLNDASTAEQVLLIQGGFGRGKTTFCRLFADRMRQEYPHWTPVLIPLQNVRSIAGDFDTFLRRVLPLHLVQTDPDWLTHGDTRFLFILDGFSEIHLDEKTGSLEQFFQQVGRFQESCANHPNMGHRVMLTGRSLLIRNLSRLMPPNLLRIEILPFDNELQDQWLAHWERLTGAAATGLKQILHQPDWSEQNLSLTREPLMLYFLAAMHRDGNLQLDALMEVSPARAKFLLYQQIFYWALTCQQPGLLHRELNPVEVESLRRLLAEAGLWTVQTGLDTVSLACVMSRLQDDQSVQALLSEIQAHLPQRTLTNALVTFSSPLTHSEPLDQPSIRFRHNSFGKLFGSRRLHEALEDWSVSLSRRQKTEPLVPTEMLDWQIFDLLGYGGLTPEMTEYLRVLLEANPDIDVAYLFKRLEDFYLRWCSGQFIDAPPETYAQKEARLLRQFGARKSGQRQVDVFAGLNVMILLLELHGYARSQGLRDIAFYPCGRQGMPGFEPERLLRLIGYSHCVSASAFRTMMGPFLGSANLSGVTLTGVNLSGVDLSGADLRSADLSGANLRGADLSRANLIGASLDGTDLSNADLRGTNLIGAYLRGADLSNAALSGADLSSANLIGASLSRADLRDADLSGAYLRGASLQTATLSRAYLIGASLSGACLSNADLGQVDLSDANLHGADLSDVNLRGADLSGADLIGAYLNGATLCGASLCNASLNSADLIGADLCGADLSSANLIGADLSDLAGAVKWSERTKWQDVRGLEAAINVPAALRQQLGLLGLNDGLDGLNDAATNHLENRSSR